MARTTTETERLDERREARDAASIDASLTRMEALVAEIVALIRGATLPEPKPRHLQLVEEDAGEVCRPTPS